MRIRIRAPSARFGDGLDLPQMAPGHSPADRLPPSSSCSPTEDHEIVLARETCGADCYLWLHDCRVDVPPLTGGKWLIGVSIPVLGGWIAAAASTNTDVFSVQFWLLTYLLVAGLAVFVWGAATERWVGLPAGGFMDPCPWCSGRSPWARPRSSCSCCSSATSSIDGAIDELSSCARELALSVGTSLNSHSEQRPAIGWRIAR